MLNNRTNLLLSDEEFTLVSQEAIKQHASVGAVIRKAIRQTYGDPNQKSRAAVFDAFRKTVKEMDLKGKGATWEELYEDRKVGRK